ncbi:hypothetical protein NC652_039475 [Populus alba x Populus x berolinensis]|nr:hypothetical protein NC652_039475 [Populus alba x Populus x berolinensis]
MTERGEVAAVLVEGDEGNWRWGREKSCVVLEGSWSVGGNGGEQIGGNEKNTYSCFMIYWHQRRDIPLDWHGGNLVIPADRFLHEVAFKCKIFFCNVQGLEQRNKEPFIWMNAMNLRGIKFLRGFIS